MSEQTIEKPIKHEHIHECACCAQKANKKEQTKFEKNVESIKFVTAVLLFVSAIVLKDYRVIQLTFFAISYLLLGYDVLLRAFSGIKTGDLFDENFLMSVSTIGAFAIGEYPEAVAVMLFFKVGEYFEEKATNKSKNATKELMDLVPQFANLLKDNQISKVAPESVQIGDTIVIKPGEKIPLDGVITSGKSQLDMSSLLGESVPQTAEIGDTVLSGSINLGSVLEVEVTNLFKDSTVSKILELLESTSLKKAKTEKFITKFSKIYTPAVVFSAIALAFIPQFFTPEADFVDWVSRSLVFLVVSCPCALVISVPLTFASGMGAASKRGILLKGGSTIQMLTEINAVVFDKTGTLTEGVFEVSEINAVGISQRELLQIAATVENLSTHPIAKSIVKKAQLEQITLTHESLSNLSEIGGLGISATIAAEEILVGNKKLMDKSNVKFDPFDGLGTAVYISKNGEFVGYIVISDKVKKDSKETITKLKKIGISNITMLTGDHATAANKVAQQLEIDNVYSELLPNEKVEKLEEIYTKNQGSKIAFVGDGINDAPVLSRAEIGVAMGGAGSAAAIETADVVIMNDEPSKLIEAINISKSTMRIVKENIAFALLIKFAALILATVGLANMWMAVFADVGVTVLVILNSMKKK